MTILQKASRAKAYYEDCRSNNLMSGWEKHVVVDDNDCMFTSINHEVNKGEALFMLSTRNGTTMCQLIKNKEK